MVVFLINRDKQGNVLFLCHHLDEKYHHHDNNQNNTNLTNAKHILLEKEKYYGEN